MVDKELRDAPAGAEGVRLPPLPPAELRRLVCHDDSLFELTPDGLAFPYIQDPRLYESVFDFGCGCGRIARQLMVQSARPAQYTGIDIHRGMIEWCQNHLTRFDPAFRFYHHDVWNLGLGPDNTRQATAPFPAAPSCCTLVVAHSIFTHLYRDQAEFYLREFARILTDGGMARTTWFLFDRATFPMLFDFQVCLFINETDPTNAVIYDWRWLLATLSQLGLRVVHTVAPVIPGHQWEIYLQKSSEGLAHAFPQDVESQRKMCGSGVSAGTVEAASAAQPPAAAMVESAIEPVIQPPRTGLTIRFTGEMDEAAFQERCREIPWWYHSYYFDNGFSVRGDYDIGKDVDCYGFPESLEGLKVLDVGTGAGWFAHYFAQLGADVVTVDARGYGDFDVYGRSFYPAAGRDAPPPDRVDENGTPVYDSPVSRGFWIMKSVLHSAIRFQNARVYELSPELFGGMKFDLVFLGAILCHLRDPIGALMAAKNVCRHRVMASTPVVIGEDGPDVLPRQYLPYTSVDKISWWLPNQACFKHWFEAAGLAGVDVSRQVKLSSDRVRFENGKAANGDQILRVGSAFVP